MIKKPISFLLMAMAISVYSYAQRNAYDPHVAFAPIFYTTNGNEYRSASGKPGPKYWQNSVDYNIAVDLDTAAKRITGSVDISYTNNSPDNLPYVWLYLDQNIYKSTSRAEATTDISGGRWANNGYTNGDEITSVDVVQNGKTSKANFKIVDTRMQIVLPEDVKANGGNISFKINYAFTVPEHGTDRMGRLLTKNGWIYEIAQWYPRMCVYDDILGWNTLPYLGAGEFYLEYGNITYSITAPSDLIIVGSGELLNPKEVLTSKQQDQLSAARKSDATVAIHTLSDVTSGSDKLNKTRLTWKFKCTQTRDVAWAASKAFIWDAARITLPSGKNILAQSVYPEESATPGAWNRSTEFTKRSIELSSRWYEFTYPTATNVAGIVGGMEYPGIVFCSYNAKGSSLWGVTNHEFGHNWFPMIVGSNERKFAWQDEGFNTFINAIDKKDFNNGEFYTKPDFQTDAGNVFNANAEALFTVPDVIQPRQLGNSAYYKPAMGLHLLRNIVLGQDRFDFAFRQYIKNWAFKHPTPFDFFRSMENASGEDLTWFWRGWFMNNWRIDQAVTKVTFDGTNKRSLITIKNREQLPFPVIAAVGLDNGKVDTVHLPVEIWQRGDTWTFPYNSSSKVISVVLDPLHQIPDIDPSNNIWQGGDLAGKPVPAGVTVQNVISKYLTKIGGAAKLQSIKTFYYRGIGDAEGTDVQLVEAYKGISDKVEEISVPDDNLVVMKITQKGDSVKISQQGQVVPNLPDNVKSRIKESLLRFPELNYNNPSYKISLDSIVYVETSQTYKITVTTPSGLIRNSYFDVNTGLKLKDEIYNDKNLSLYIYSDYQPASGILYPTKMVFNRGELGINIMTKEIKIDGEIPDSVFKN